MLPLNKINIAIDGPAASGKSTVAGRLASRLGYLYLDTGVMYRAVTWAALERGVAIEDEQAITRLAESLSIEVTRPTKDDGRQYTVYADGQDVTWEIRDPRVNQYVSPVSAYRGVRKALVAQQRRIGAQGGVIMVGRDIGTVVLPDAQVKIYLDATPEERARRRYLEILPRDPAVCYDQVLQDLQRRDRIDSTREESPLQVPPDAVVIDSTTMQIEEVVDRMAEIVRGRLRPGCERAEP
jgi:cytidylate kinase